MVVPSWSARRLMALALTFGLAIAGCGSDADVPGLLRALVAMELPISAFYEQRMDVEQIAAELARRELDRDTTALFLRRLLTLPAF